MSSIFILTQPTSAMIRRLAPAAMIRNCGQKTTPLAATTLYTSQRHLLPGQENNPLWIEANEEITDFLKKHNIPAPTPAQIQNEQKQLLNALFDQYTSQPQHPVINMPSEEITEETLLASIKLNKQCKKLINEDEKQKKLFIDSYMSGDFFTFATQCDKLCHDMKDLHKALTPEEKSVEQETKDLLLKHNINPHAIPIRFYTKDNENVFAATDGIMLYLYPRIVKADKETRKAVIEHEICHIIMHDVITKMFLEKHSPASKRDKIFEIDIILKEKRADIHSAIQSLNNAIVFEKIGYCLRYEFYRHGANMPSLKVLVDIFSNKYNYVRQAQDYHRQNNSKSESAEGTDDSTNTGSDRTTSQKVYSAKIGATMAAGFLYKKHQDNKLISVDIKKNWLGFKPSSSTIWQTAKENKLDHIAPETHTYSIIDCKTHWKICFRKK